MPNLTKDGFRQSAPERRGETCPNCKNSDAARIAPVTEGGPYSRAAQEAHETWGRPKQQVRLIGSRCLNCGHEWRL